MDTSHSLGQQDNGFELDYAFMISDPLFSCGPLLDYFPVMEGFSGSGSQSAFISGSEMNVSVQWSGQKWSG